MGGDRRFYAALGTLPLLVVALAPSNLDVMTDRQVAYEGHCRPFGSWPEVPSKFPVIPPEDARAIAAAEEKRRRRAARVQGSAMQAPSRKSRT